MRKLYVKLAAVNIRNNRQLYLPYLLAGVFSAAMFYLVQSIQDNPGLDQMRGGANVAVTLLLGVIIVGLFAAIFLFYTNSFIMKRRKRELSVYNILGMEKKHIAKVLFLEMLFTAAVTIGGGLAFGIVFGKLMTMLLYRMTGFNQSVPFTISLTGCHHTLVLFGCIYAVTLFYNFMQRFFPPSAKLCRTQFCITEMENRLNIQHTSRQTCRFSDSAAMLQIFQVFCRKKDMPCTTDFL